MWHGLYIEYHQTRQKQKRKKKKPTPKNKPTQTNREEEKGKTEGLRFTENFQLHAYISMSSSLIITINRCHQLFSYFPNIVDIAQKMPKNWSLTLSSPNAVTENGSGWSNANLRMFCETDGWVHRKMPVWESNLKCQYLFSWCRRYEGLRGQISLHISSPQEFSGPGQDSILRDSWACTTSPPRVF